MSYDIEWKVRVEDTDLWVKVDMPYNYNYNITWNVRDIITQSTGLTWDNEQDNGLVKDVILKIIDGYKELLTNSEKYKQYEPDNGWGSVESTKKFFKDLIDAWDAFCQDSWARDLKDYVHFWIM